MAERRFTRDQANRLLPRLRRLLAEVQSAHRQLVEEGRVPRLAAVAGVNGGGEAATAVLAAEARLRRAVAAVEALGVVLRDPATGLVDFPAERGGEAIYLCWRLGEPAVEYWHGRDAGFAGRQPL